MFGAIFNASYVKSGSKFRHEGGGYQKGQKFNVFYGRLLTQKNGTKTACALAEQICFEMHKRKIDFVASNVTN